MKKEIVIQSLPERITEVEHFIESLRDEFEFRDDAFGNVMVATTEAVNNSIIHGNESDGGKNVTVACETAGTYRLRVTVSDAGKGFDHSSLADPTAPENLENPGGRGVFLMTHLSDEIYFRDEGRVVEMVFNI